MTPGSIDPAVLTAIGGAFAWLIALTGGGAFFMGRLSEKVAQHTRELERGQEKFSAIEEEAAEIAKAFIEMRGTLAEVQRYNVAIWRKLSAKAA